ncbi:HupE/UreJ family protein [Paenibacillus thalictri]|uniref:HupE/UreJ family protein n=2 Tax=Paenibacillus thalictri TaxID=2527873 RepID=A0A4V2J4R2_9BACL|nr:HupE/UreJ family protein [Paenibacillus thalictri]
MDLDANKDGKLDEKELESGRHRVEEWIDDSVVLEADGRDQEGKLENMRIEKKNDKEFVSFEISYPAFQPGQTVSLNDGLYYGDATTTYTNFLTAQVGSQLSQAILQGKQRLWTMLLTEDQQEQERSQTAVGKASGQPGNMSGAGGIADKQGISGGTPALAGGSAVPAGAGQAQKTAQPHAAAEAVVSQSNDTAWFAFFKLGIMHILSGYDHLLFLFALLIRKQKFKEYAAVITAFTIAHSITLTLAVLDIVSLPSRLVESAIALSICYVALENIFRKEIRYRWTITFLFGLVHGIGFADILQEMELPKSRIAVDLISFNLGIEAVQLALLIVLLPLLAQLQKLRPYPRAVHYGSYLIVALGGVWLVERLFF